MPVSALMCGFGLGALRGKTMTLSFVDDNGRSFAEDQFNETEIVKWRRNYAAYLPKKLRTYNPPRNPMARMSLYDMGLRKTFAKQ